MLQAQQRLGEFEIVRLLGKGGMGEVYEAIQDRPRRRVALKVLAPCVVENEDNLKRFWREAETPAQLDHPGIVRIISTGETDGIAYYTMHLVQGITLDELMRKASDVYSEAATCLEHAERTPSVGAPVPGSAEEIQFVVSSEPPSSFLLSYRTDRYRTLARIGVMVARALSYAHARGCVHRDLKPANIMVDQHDQACVMDFGLTRIREADGVNSQPGVMLGTPWYMSPEQARVEDVDHRSDIYSLGVTLYELATAGKGPYSGSRKSGHAVLEQVRAGRCQSLRSLAPDIPPALERIILKAMSYRASRRYADAGQLATDLERFLGQAPAAPSSQGPAPHWTSQRIMPAAAIALLVVVALAVAMWPSLKPGKTAEDSTKLPPVKAAIQWPADYPEQLRDRKWKVAQALLTVDHNPVWKKRLAGNGKFRRQPFQLILSSSPHDENPMLLALDDDLARRWFEFAVDLQAPREEPGKNRIGVFFGWRKESSRFFVVEIDEHPRGPFQHGVARIGTLRLIEKGPAEAAVNEFRWFPGDLGQIPLMKSDAWHRLVVRVVDDRIVVAVDGNQSAPITMNGLGQGQRDGSASLAPRGAIGLWMWNGIFGSFRNASVAALPGAGTDSE